MRDDLIDKHDGAWRKMDTHWDRAVAQWDDLAQRRFDEEFWSELTMHHHQTHEAMLMLLDTLAKAQRFLKSQGI